jgi:NAD+ diphosphatase
MTLTVGTPGSSLPGFVGGTLDRVDHIRTNPALLEAAFAHDGARFLVLDGLDPVADDGGLATGPLPIGASVSDYALLGEDEKGPLFVPLKADQASAPSAPSRVWRLAEQLSPSDLAHYGAGRSLILWHARHGYCSNCGHRTHVVKAGWSRQCGSCGAEHFPRVDPVAIMLAEHEGRVLVGRQHGFPTGRYSALAGFIEPGETIEEAVARELWEEAGIRVSRVRYVMSQPWPFPSSLMIACIGQSESDLLRLDETEIQHAFWVDAEGVRAALEEREDAPFIAPPKIAIAHFLLRAWLDEVDSRSDG